MLFNNHFYL